MAFPRLGLFDGLCTLETLTACFKQSNLLKVKDLVISVKKRFDGPHKKVQLCTASPLEKEEAETKQELETCLHCCKHGSQIDKEITNHDCS
jgi:hypothetical protein